VDFRCEKECARCIGKANMAHLLASSEIVISVSSIGDEVVRGI